MRQFTDEASTKYGDVVPANEVLAVDQHRHLVAKLRIELLSDENPEDIVACLQNRHLILRIMSGKCPEIQTEILQITIAMEEKILLSMRKFMGINNHADKIKIIQTLINKPRTKDPALQEMTSLFTTVMSLPVFRKRGLSVQAYLSALLARTKRQLTNLPFPIIERIFNHVFAFNPYECYSSTYLHILKSLATVKLFPLIDEYYRQRFQFCFREAHGLMHGNDAISQREHWIMYAATRDDTRYLKAKFQEDSQRIG